MYTFAPTAQFKCCCDSAGSCLIRATNAWEAFLAVLEMPQPQQRVRNSTYRFQLSVRRHKFVVFQAGLSLEMSTRHDVITIILPRGNKIDTPSIPNIRGTYQFRTAFEDSGT